MKADRNGYGVGRFTGKTVIVTGGNSGIGRDAAIRFAREGARVAIFARTAESGRSAVAEITGHGGEAAFFSVDVADEEQVETATRSVIARYGGFEIVFNCSGVTGTGKSFDQVSSAEFDAVIKTNLYGTFYCMKHQIAHFVERGSGAIVNCASTSGLVGFAGLAPYTASKHAMLGLTKSVALDYARQGIRVNAVCPGGVLTPMLADYLADHPEEKAIVEAGHPAGRMADVGEISALVLWLASDEASNVIGQAFAIDGGFTAR